MIELSKKNARLWSIMGINPSVWSIGFGEVAEQISDIAVITADLAKISGLERMAAKYPERFYNVGIAEQNMLGIAAGFAMENIQTYVTTYAPFVTFRCADQVRHFMGNMNLDIKAIGSAAGLTSGWSGTALLAVNDIAFMRSIPNMVILNPADCAEAIKLMIEMSKTKHPVYMRFCGNVNIPIVYTEDYEIEIGRAITLRQGKDIALIATGTDVVFNTLKAADILEKRIGIQATVINMHTIKPIDTACLDEVARNHSLIFTIEEHNVIGGLGSAVAEHFITTYTKIKQKFIGIPDQNCKMGNRFFMLDQVGLTADKIVDRIEKEITGNGLEVEDRNEL